ncbi:hypothetical protein Angca_004422, partial [Angiostrongylus cantonensis]
QDLDARESDVCAVSATCLQADSEIPSSYLQCDQTSLRWVRRSCQDGFVFNFEQQTCVVPKRMSSLSPGGCVNGQCGAGYTCQNGLCCAGTTAGVRCLDGSEAVGACIPSCQGDGCGGVQITYYCGSGYTCTTGNICCP